MTPQALFNRCAYLMVSDGASPRESLDGIDLSRVPGRSTLRALQRDLQRVFDDYGPSAWPDQLSRVARSYQLESA